MEPEKFMKINKEGIERMLQKEQQILHDRGHSDYDIFKQFTIAVDEYLKDNNLSMSAASPQDLDLANVVSFAQTLESAKSYAREKELHMQANMYNK